MASNMVPITGFTTSIREYTRVEGIILRPAEAIVKYGTLVLIRDESQSADYLGMITNVEEETPHPALDVERLRRLYQSMEAASLEDANRVLQELLSPTHQLIKWSSIMRVEIRVLGLIEDTGAGEKLSTYERPPRPFSSIAEPDPERLERIIHYSLGRDYMSRGIYIGKLSLYDRVRIYMNPERLTTHLSILAQTGGGKTETVKRLVFEISQRRKLISKPKGGIVVFDIAGEYTGYPYSERETAFLVDAVLSPTNYSGAIDNPSIPEKTTIIVPYETSRGLWHEQQLMVWRGMRDLACNLAERTGRTIDLIVVFPYERKYERIGPPFSSVSRHRKITYNIMTNIIRDSQFLIVGLPLPGFMDMDTMIELSGTKSEYFPLILGEIAGILDLYHGDDIYGIGLLAALFRHWSDIERISVREQDVAEAILGVYKAACETGKWDPAALKQLLSAPELKKKYQKTLSVSVVKNLFLEDKSKALFYGFFRYFAWKAYRWGAADPYSDSESEAVCRLLLNRSYEQRISGILQDLVLYIRRARSARIEANIIYSALRALRKLSMITSDMVDTVVFDILMSRLMEGFTIIHLAPPSVGDVDMLLSLLVRRLFYMHAGDYDRDRLTILVVEEAHNLAPANVKTASKASLLRVAREGRKWGLSLWLVTQRPSFVDSSILSQTATSILLRTTNPEDLASIKRGVESAASDIVDRLPELEPSRGEALLTGLAAPERRIPLLVMVERLRRIKD